MKRVKGLVLVYTGAGKGKTTAALGAAVRMIRHKNKVAWVEFFKPRTPYSVRLEGLKVWSFGGGFTWRTPREENQRTVDLAWKKCRGLLRDAEYSLVIFDEINIALKHKFLKTADVVRALRKRPAGQHVILTGRGAPAGLKNASDLVTEMKCVKHPYDRGIPAQQGVEF